MKEHMTKYDELVQRKLKISQDVHHCLI